MKKSVYIIGLLCAAGALTSCEKDLEVFSDNTCRLNFHYDGVESRSQFKEQMAVNSYSFVYGSAELDNDTIWYEVETMGKVSNSDRTVTLEQIQVEDADNAVAGTHYVAFNDATLADKYVIPAGKTRAKLPVVMLRDASLKESTVTLKFRIKPNGNFVEGYPEFQEQTLTFTDQLAEPSIWSKRFPYPDYPDYDFGFSDYFGTWGPVKHNFLIEETGQKWDDEYIDGLMNGDGGYYTYMIRKMAKRLEQVNAERAAQGLDPLAEADGTPVTIIDPYAYY